MAHVPSRRLTADSRSSYLWVNDAPDERLGNGSDPADWHGYRTMTLRRRSESDDRPCFPADDLVVDFGEKDTSPSRTPPEVTAAYEARIAAAADRPGILHEPCRHREPPPFNGFPWPSSGQFKAAVQALADERARRLERDRINTMGDPAAIVEKPLSDDDAVCIVLWSLRGQIDSGRSEGSDA